MILEPCELGSRTAVRDGAHGKHQGRTQGVNQVGRESRRNADDSNYTVPAQRVCGLFQSVPARKFLTTPLPAPRTGDKCRDNIKNIEQPVLYRQETEEGGWSLSLLEVPCLNGY